MKKSALVLLFGMLFYFPGTSQKIKASFSPSIYNEPFSGKVIVYLSKENKSPKDGSVGLDQFPCFAVEVKNIKPGTFITIDDMATAYPVALSDIERGEYYLQIVWDRNLGGRSIANSAGNFYNETEKINITKNRESVFSIVANKQIAAPKLFKETNYVKELKAPSTLLSNFHKKEMTVDAVVILPKQYYINPEQKFPVLFEVSGYGGDYHELSGSTKASKPMDTTPVIRIFLDGNCQLGHSVYANSDNNGPWGDALTKEFIPLLEKNYRCNGAKLLTGHSSGGWTVLWLQTQYPKVFDGCWSSSPDPVDFRKFQKVNLYEDRNMFYAKDSSQNLVATVAGFIPWGTMKNFYQMENVIYRGEQMHSFNAVFSKKGSDGMPEPICNAASGEIDKAVFDHWKKFDISLNLRNNWEQLKADLDNNVRISIGTADNFLLNYAVYMLENEIKLLKANFVFKYYPGDHFTVWTNEYAKEGNLFLEEKYSKWLERNKRLENK